MPIYNQLQLREVFHLEFLRWLGRKIKARHYALKGGVNLRLFFNSLRYSEDMDLDASGIEKYFLRDTVMTILESGTFQDCLKPFGIERIAAPNMTKAKQTETTQRCNVHSFTSPGQDLLTKIEFSKRGFKGEVLIQPVMNVILRLYRLPPLLVPHYSIASAVSQKLDALASRAVIQARDVFDLYVLSSQYEHEKKAGIAISKLKLASAYDNIFEISFEQFRDTVTAYLSAEDQDVYNKESMWEEVKIRVAQFIEELREHHA